MLYKKSFQVIIACISCLIFLNSIAVARQYNRPPFLYTYHGKDEKLIDKLDRELRKKLKYIESRLRCELDGRVQIFLTLTLQDFNMLTRGRVPSWAGGVAYPRRGAVVLKTPLFFGQGVPVEVLAAHELTHILIHKIVGDNYLPRWFEEGLCQVLSGETRHGSLGRLGRAAVSDRLMGLPRVDDVLGFSGPDADLAYAESRSAVAWLVERYGWETIVSLLRSVGKGTDFEDAFPAIIGVEYEYWQVEWIEYAKKKYSLAVLLDIDNLIWVFIFMLGALAVTVVFIRRRLQFRRWLEEEDEDDLDDEPISPS